MNRILIFLMLLACCLYPAAEAQIDRTEINCTVTDPAGASVAGATVIVTQTDTNQIRSIRTGGHGESSVSSLPIGHFSIRIVGRGFRDLNVVDNSLLVPKLNRYYVIVPPASGRGVIDAFSTAR